MKQAFTLVELLVVVLIIGILSAIAIPMYQGAVDKSHWSTLLTPAKALQTAQAAAHLETGAYAEQADALVVSLAGETQDNKYIMPNATYSIQTKNNNQSTITGELTALPNVRLSMSLKSPNSYLFCDAKTGDARAERLCGKLLGGTKGGTKDGYTKYLLDSDICVWAESTGECYASKEEKCTALGGEMSTTQTNSCVYKNESPEEFDKGDTCFTDMTGKCNLLEIDEGACISNVIGNTCRHLTVTNGGICVANAGGTGDSVVGGCYNTSFTNGSICYANVPNSCGNHYQDTTYWSGKNATSYDSTSCCCGAYCGNKPSCDSRGVTCDPYYMDPNNFKDL